MSHNTVDNISKMLSFLKLESNLRTIGLFCCDEQRAIAEAINFTFSSWLSRANESNKKKHPTDNKSNIKRALGHCEQKNPFILSKFDDLQSRIAKLKSVENLQKFKPDSVTIKKRSPTYLLPEFEIIADNRLAFTIKVYEQLLPEVRET